MEITKVEYQSEVLREAIRDCISKQAGAAVPLDAREELVAAVLGELAKIFTRSQIGDQLITVAIKKSSKPKQEG